MNSINPFWRVRRKMVYLVTASFLALSVMAHAAPTGGVVTAGSAAINQAGSTTTINQSSQNAAINWQSFGIGASETVNFVQPNVSSITLNRVIGNEQSVINGTLNANGQVFILNSNGILFGNGASINTAGLVATTMSLSDADFMSGNYSFTGASDASVINMGQITVTDGGYAALLAKDVENEGTITAVKGKIYMTGADSATINLNGNSLLSLTVDKGVVDALVSNRGAVIANGGEIYLTANAADELLKSVVNNTGILEAQTLDDIQGKIIVFAHGGEAEIGGTLSTGAGEGFIETSGKEFSIADGTTVTTGEWLIDPVNITINGALAGAIETALGTGDVTISTDGGNTPDTAAGESGTDGNITVASEIEWAADNTLTLSAAKNIIVNADITHTGSSAGGVIFLYGQGSADGGTSTYSVGAGASVTADSIQWRKGSDLDSARYAIVDGNYYLGNKYIELGIKSSNGIFGASATPSIFFGRQSGAGIGMVGDADGFATGDDLRIDYFLPGTPYEDYILSVDGVNYSAYSGGMSGVTLSDLTINADNTISAVITSTAGGVTVEQNISLAEGKSYFYGDIELTNSGGTDLNNVIFGRVFDPDNTVDMSGNFVTINTVQSQVSDGASASAVSATSLSGDTYNTTAGSQANIIYFTADENSYAGISLSSTLTSALTSAQSQDAAYTNTTDSRIGLVYDIGTLSAGETSEVTYFASLDNRAIDTIIDELGEASTPVVVPEEPEEPEVPEIPVVETPEDTSGVEHIVTTIINTNLTTPPVIFIPSFDSLTVPGVPVTPVLPPQVLGSFGADVNIDGNSLTIVTEPANNQTMGIVTLDELGSSQEGGAGGLSSGANPEIRVGVGDNSIVQLVNGGLAMPEDVSQQFYVVQKKKD